MYVKCTTNLDLYNENWPDNLLSVPRVGDLIESKVEHTSTNFRLRLKVVAVTWKFDKEIYYPEIELHDYFNRSIKSFYEWYAPLVQKSVGYFI